MLQQIFAYFKNTHSCQYCYKENPINQSICSFCSHLIVPVSLEEKEKRMMEFSGWFTSEFVVDGTNDAIRVKKISVKNGYIVYDFGKGKFSWIEFAFGLHTLIGAIIYLTQYTRPVYWKANFNELGWVTAIRDNEGALSLHTLQKYIFISREYRKFCEANPYVTKRFFLFEWIDRIYGLPNAYRYIITIFGFILIIIGMYFTFDGK